MAAHDDPVRHASPPPRVQAARITSRAPWPILFVIAALIALAVVPTAMRLQVSRVRNELQKTTRPARQWLTEVHIGLAQAAGAVRNYLITGDTAEIAIYEKAREREESAYEHLEPLLAQIGGPVKERFDALRQISQDWHETNLHVLKTHDNNERTQLERTERFEGALVAAALLDEAITREAADSENDLARQERTALIIAYAVFLIGMVAVFVTARLGDELRTYANVAVARQAELAHVMASKEQLLHGLAHDVKNPLGAIQGYAYLLETGAKGALTSAQKAAVGRIEKSVEDAVAIIDSLLRLAKLESTELEVERKEVQVDELVHNVVDQHRGAFEAKGIDLQMDERASAPAVWTDPDRVAEVLSNLLSNARKYTPSGGSVNVRVHPAVRPGNGANSGIAIDVQDSGPGIARDQQDFVFTEFARLRPEADAPGAGIGLTISKKLANLLGGDISLDSDVGRGSVFTLWLPADGDRFEGPSYS